MAGEGSLSSPSAVTSGNQFNGEGNELDDNAEAKALFRPLSRKPGLLEPRQGQDEVPILTRTDSRDGSWSPHLRDLHMLSFPFLFVFLAFSALQNMESSINTDRGLGSAALGLLYLSLTVSSLGASMVVMWVGSKSALILGLSGYWAFIIANLYPSWYTLIPAAVFLGFTASVLWIAEGRYLTFAAKRHAAVCNVTEATALGNFNGVFWGIFQSNQVYTQFSALLCIFYLQDIEAALAQWKIWESAGTSAVFFTSPYANFETKLYVLFFSLLSSGLNWTVFHRDGSLIDSSAVSFTS